MKRAAESNGSPAGRGTAAGGEQQPGGRVEGAEAFRRGRRWRTAVVASVAVHALLLGGLVFIAPSWQVRRTMATEEGEPLYRTFERIKGPPLFPVLIAVLP